MCRVPRCFRGLVEFFFTNQKLLKSGWFLFCLFFSFKLRMGRKSDASHLWQLILDTWGLKYLYKYNLPFFLGMKHLVPARCVLLLLSYGTFSFIILMKSLFVKRPALGVQWYCSHGFLWGKLHVSSVVVCALSDNSILRCWAMAKNSQ